jgi:MFS family permease
MASLMAFAQNATQFYVLRFALGAAEADFFPGIIYHFTRWLPAADRGKAIALLLSGSAIASILSGPLSGFLVQFPAFGMKGWQSMLVIEGLFSVLIGATAWFWLDSKPSDARWLTPAQKQAIEESLAEEQRAREAVQTERPSAWDLVRDP